MLFTCAEGKATPASTAGPLNVSTKVSCSYIDFPTQAALMFALEHLQRFDKSIPLYVATDEKDKAWFDPFKTEYGFKKLVFWDDLAADIKDQILPKYPTTMRGDLIGFLEQIICAKAKNFAGSHGSTFSAAIMALRRNKKLRAIKLPESSPKRIEANT